MFISLLSSVYFLVDDWDRLMISNGPGGGGGGSAAQEHLRKQIPLESRKYASFKAKRGGPWPTLLQFSGGLMAGNRLPIRRLSNKGNSSMNQINV